MKFKIILLLAAVTALLSGCKSNETTMCLRSISFTADIVYYNENYSADCIIDGEGDFIALLTKPDNLYGLSLEYSGAECKIKYNGIEIQNPQSFIPQNCSLDIVRHILKETENAVVKSDKGNCVTEGRYSGIRYSLTASPAGFPISLEMPDIGMSIVFKNVTVIKS